MIEHPAPQGTTEWREARYGRPTASRFGRIVTPGGKPSKSQAPYAAELTAEWALGEGVDDSLADNPWVARGKALEADARRYAAMVTGTKIRDCGLIYRDDGRTEAASPDGLADDVTPVELKCPMPKTHLLWLAQGLLPRAHVMQVQGQIWVCGAASAVFVSYCPGLPALVLEIDPDPRLQEAIGTEVPRVVAMVREFKARLRDLGVQPAADWFGGAE